MKKILKNKDKLFIQSFQNSLIKKISLIIKKQNSQYTKFFVSEGDIFIREAIYNKWDITDILYEYTKINFLKKENYYEYLLKHNTKISFVDKKILRKLLKKDNPQNHLFVTKKKKFCAPKNVKLNNVFIALESIRDPGNLGNIFRTMESFGIKFCFLIGNCVSPYSSEVIRASMGSIFNLQFSSISVDRFLDWVNKNNINLYGTSPYSNTNHYNYSWLSPLTIVMGNENSGVSQKLIDNCKSIINIKMQGRSKSLNVSVASGIIINELYRKFPI